MDRTVHVADAAARFADQENSRRHVPGVQAELPERVEAPSGDVRQVDRRRTGAAHAVRSHRYLVIEMDVDVVMPLPAGKAGGSETVRQALRLRYLNPVIVQPGAGAALGAEHFAPDRVENHACDHFTRPLQAERHVEHRKAVREIRGAVQRVHVPAELGGAFVPSAFFGHDSVRGKMRPQPLDHEFLAGAIGFGDEVEIALQLEAHAALEEVGEQRSGLARDLHRGLEVRHYDSSIRYLMSCLKMKRFGWPSRVMRMKLLS